MRAIPAIALLASLSACPVALCEDAPKAPRDYVELSIAEPLGCKWSPQVVQTRVVFEKHAAPATLDLRDAQDREVPFQVVDPAYYKDRLAQCMIAFVTGLGPFERAYYRLYYAEEAPAAAEGKTEDPTRPRLLVHESLLKAVISTGRISMRILGAPGSPDSPIPNAPPPVDSIMGADGVWRGCGEFLSTEMVRKWTAKAVASGPVFAEVEIRYELTGGRFYEVRVKAVAGADYITVAESFDIGGNSCFLLRSPSLKTAEIPQRNANRPTGEIITRLAAHWQPGLTVAKLPARRFESVSAADGNDQFAFFTVAPGRWDNPVGSEINYIRSDNNLMFHFPLGKGTRRWGVHATTLADANSLRICRVISLASDAALDDVLKLLPATQDSLVVVKGAPEAPGKLKEACEVVGSVVQSVLDQGYAGPISQEVNLPCIGSAAQAYRLAADAGQASSPEAFTLRTRLAYLGCVLCDPSLFNCNVLLRKDAAPGANFDPLTIRWIRNVERFCTLAQVAAALPDHPKASEWTAHAREQLGLTLEHLLKETGGWKGGDHQHKTVLAMLDELAVLLKASGPLDARAEQALQLMRGYEPRIKVPEGE